MSDKLTHKNILTKFAVQIKCMEPNLLIDKTQDEARQGEAYASQANSGVFEKHFYVESYGCAMNFADSEVVAAILEKDNAVEDFRKLIGATNPANAEEGTIRKIYAKSVGENAIHGSDSDENAQIEGSFFFSSFERI